MVSKICLSAVRNSSSWFLLLCLVSPLSAAAQPQSLDLPGGLAPITRLFGTRNAPLDPASALERIFTHVLLTEPAPGSLGAPNQVRQDLLAYLEGRTRLMRQLEKEGAVSAGAQDAVFRLTGTPVELENTRKLLSYVRYGTRITAAETGNQGSIEFEPEKDINAAQRALALGLGINNSDQDSREIFITRSERLSLILDEQTWEEIVPGSGPENLFSRFIAHPEAMRLYIALSSCSQETAKELAQRVSPDRLLKSSGMLYLFGFEIRIEEGALKLPGRAESWEALLNISSSDTASALNALLTDGSIPLLLYSSLSAAPDPVRQYITASPERLKGFYKILKKYEDERCCGSVITKLAEDLQRILRQLTVHESGLVFAMDSRLSKHLLHRLAPEEVNESDQEPIVITPKILARILPPAGVSPYADTSRSGVIEFFRYLNDTRPGVLTPDSIRALTTDPENTAAFLDIIGDLSPSAALLSKYLRYCIKTTAAGNRDWNTNRTRTSQSIFFLISALCREGTIRPEQANSLLDGVLEAFDTNDESQFAVNTAEFLSTRLLPEVTALSVNAPDPLLTALSGNPQPLRINWRGKELTLDRNARRPVRVQQSMQTQSHTELSVLLEIFGLLQKIGFADGNDPERVDRLTKLSEKAEQIRSVEKGPAVAAENAEAGQIAGIKAAMKSSKISRSHARSVAARLHRELGITLLTYCYAYMGMPDIDVFAFDPNLVRKHRFYPDMLRKPAWNNARFVQDDELGGWMEGSVAGIALELIRLQSAQADQGLRKSPNTEMLQAVTAGIRQIRPRLLTDRSQAYVALATRLGSHLIAYLRSNRDSAAGQWIDNFLNYLITQERLERVRRQPADEDAPANILSRSELFLLGQAFYNSHPAFCRVRKYEGGIDCTIINRLDDIVPGADTVEYNSFREEVSQYGMSLHNRIGFSRLSFSLIDPYERLEKHLRPQYLYDRLCDLKIRIAEINYAMGLPASLGELQANLALKAVMAETVEKWQEVMEKVNNLSAKVVPLWIDELIRDGSLVPEFVSSRTPNL